MIESELFGHERGAFTGVVQQKVGILEQGDGGTVFFDGIDAVSMELQWRLFDFIRSGKFRRIGGTQTIESDVRIIAATNKDLRDGDSREQISSRAVRAFECYHA